MLGEPPNQHQCINGSLLLTVILLGVHARGLNLPQEDGFVTAKPFENLNEQMDDMDPVEFTVQEFLMTLECPH